MTGQPYTHIAHTLHCIEQARQGHFPRSQRVQVLKQGVHYCAELIAPYNPIGGPDCWIVQATFPEIVRFAVSCKNTRLCVRCACAGAEGAPSGEGSAPALAGAVGGVTC